MSASALLCSLFIVVPALATLIHNEGRFAIVSSMIVIENNVGATSRKGVSRFFGSIVGGVVVFGAISLISWGGDRWVIGTDSTGVAIIAPGVLYTTRYGIGPLSNALFSWYNTWRSSVGGLMFSLFASLSNVLIMYLALLDGDLWSRGISRWIMILFGVFWGFVASFFVLPQTAENIFFNNVADILDSSAKLVHPLIEMEGFGLKTFVSFADDPQARWDNIFATLQGIATRLGSMNKLLDESRHEWKDWVLSRRVPIPLLVRRGITNSLRESYHTLSRMYFSSEVMMLGQQLTQQMSDRKMSSFIGPWGLTSPDEGTQGTGSIIPRMMSSSLLLGADPVASAVYHPECQQAYQTCERMFGPAILDSACILEEVFKELALAVRNRRCSEGKRHVNTCVELMSRAASQVARVCNRRETVYVDLMTSLERIRKLKASGQHVEAHAQLTAAVKKVLFTDPTAGLHQVYYEHYLRALMKVNLASDMLLVCVSTLTKLTHFIKSVIDIQGVFPRRIIGRAN
ncbi:MAG: uncharacterized protein KVP18_000632 [Porospora cf. gigantea A]|uniref:uncharacterized protein n=1 Tax=Porospora cf. gigantea A TaxID=2853593 RepID=UPI00355AAE4E|nr:MAG: hypothetical protein KVP18_000632 [Porospora cf. gigantea A]